MENNWRNIRGAAAALEELGIPVSRGIVAEFERSFKSMPPETLDALDVTAMLLSALGVGHYDYKNQEWTPTSDMVYSFDMEVYDIDRMYTLFLKGVQAISGDEFRIGEICEEAGGVEYPTGRGTRIVRFLLDGRPCLYRARENCDWFDLGMLDYMNEVLSQTHNPKRLFFMSDGYQECILFYCTQFWAKRFEKKTGCPLYDHTDRAQAGSAPQR